jgi:predicted ATPase/serine phosphatase RsbU (regulator of sigma subunit)
VLFRSFNYAFEKLISAVSTKAHPLTLFLDDAQWADKASYDLLNHILSSEIVGHFFLVLAFRDDLVERNHPLLEFISGAVTHRNVSVESICLSALNERDIEGMLSDLLKYPNEKVAKLASLVQRKTGGNPFFITQFLKRIHSENLVVFNPVIGWIWDENAIDKLPATENLIRLMEEKISALPSKTLEILKIWSCIGNGFDLETLADATGNTVDDVLRHFGSVMSEGYVKMVDGRLYHHHGRIQDAAYGLIPAKERARYHYTIGKRLLFSVLGPRDRYENLFHITDQLNLGRELMTGDDELRQLSELNFESGMKAKAAVAFDSAWEYFRKSAEYVDEKSWMVDYEKTLALFEECAETACLNGMLDQMERFAERIGEHARSVLDLVRITEIRMRAYYSVQEYAGAWKTALAFLKELDFSYPAKVTRMVIALELVKVKLALRNMDDETVLNLPPMTDEHMLAVFRIINAMGVSASMTDIHFYAYLIVRRVLMIVRYGLNPYSGTAFAAYGGILISALGDVRGGIHFGDLALRISERREERPFLQRVHVTYDLFIRHWKESLMSCRVQCASSVKLAREAGDPPYTGLALTFGDFVSILTSEDMTLLWGVVTERKKITEQNRQKALMQFHDLILQWVAAVTGKNGGFTNLSGAYFNSGAVLAEWEEKRNLAGLIHFYTLNVLLNYLGRDYAACLENLAKTSVYVSMAKAHLVFQVLTWFDALVKLTACDGLKGPELKKNLKNAAGKVRKIKAWAEIEPTKHLPWVHLLAAEQKRVTGRHDNVQEDYDKAIAGFENAPFPIMQAIACERAALYNRDKGLMRIARAYAEEAVYYFERLGMKPVIERLKMDWPDAVSLRRERRLNVNNIRNPERRSENLDFSTILKNALALSQEIDLERLLEHAMRLAIENAGAQRGFLILENKETGGLNIEATGRLDHSVEVLKSIPVEGNTGLAVSIVKYVFTTGENIVLSDATQDGRFSTDPYIISHKPRSVLCGCIRHKGFIAGLLYLENNLITGAFTEERLKLLTLLSSHAAVSIENARLFSSVRNAEKELRNLNLELEQRVTDRTLALDRSLKKVEEANQNFLSSLRYSRVIQTALLPDRERMKACIPESFSIWNPRDLIGGDMYYFEELQRGFLLAVIDCTGHGVPGAFMTMIAISGLRRIVSQDGETLPSIVLKKLNHFVKNSLQQGRENSQSDEGLDAAICRYDRDSDTLMFSGAGLPLYFVKKGDVSEIRGNRQSIGYAGSDPGTDFTVHVLENAGGFDGFYLSTDGYIDQLGNTGSERQRFGKNRLRALLSDSFSLPFEQQKRILTMRLLEHSAGETQTDDITFVGFTLKSQGK